MIKLFYDLETTGTDERKHSIHQLSGMLEIDGAIVEEFDYYLKPHPKAKIEPEALSICGVTEEDIMSYPDMKVAYNKLIALLDMYIDRYDNKNKAWLVGFNINSFDNRFLRKFFELNGNQFFGSYFWSDSLDVMVLASQYLLERRTKMRSFKLAEVARQLGLEVECTTLHNAMHDNRLTREIYRIVTGLEIEI